MSKTYITRAFHLADDAWGKMWESSKPHRTDITVVERRHEQPQETGLLDQHGNPLFRLPDTPRPAGFLVKWR